MNTNEQSGFIDANTQVRNALNALPCPPYTTTSLQRKTAALREAIVNMGYGTGNNRRAVQLVEYSRVEPKSPSGNADLTLRIVGKDLPLMDVINTMEGEPIHPAVRTQYPDLTQEEWDAVLRVALMVVESFDVWPAPVISDAD